MSNNPSAFARRLLKKKVPGLYSLIGVYIGDNGRSYFEFERQQGTQDKYVYIYLCERGVLGDDYYYILEGQNRGRRSCTTCLEVLKSFDELTWLDREELNPVNLLSDPDATEETQEIFVLEL
jgi:hypothetical protein